MCYGEQLAEPEHRAARNALHLIVEVMYGATVSLITHDGQPNGERIVGGISGFIQNLELRATNPPPEGQRPSPNI